MTLYLRALTEEERDKVARLTRAQTAPVRLACRARIIQLAADHLSVPTIAARLDLSEKAVRRWVTRFNDEGLEGLEDAPRSGRPRTYSEGVRSQVIAKARGLPPKPTDPSQGDVPPTCHWTLDRLQEELAKDGLPIKRSQIRRILRAEHLKWQKPRTWLESTDPDFAAKRGRLSSSTPIRRRAAR